MLYIISSNKLIVILILSVLFSACSSYPHLYTIDKANEYQIDKSKSNLRSDPSKLKWSGYLHVFDRINLENFQIQVRFVDQNKQALKTIVVPLHRNLNHRGVHTRHVCSQARFYFILEQAVHHTSIELTLIDSVT
uniref:hypothetical protein n=1 Tax=Ningiella ruwaisensis TaxID=2364274 RepID=UPI00109FE73C|nr:hypothetical protein [Ningiella ruwaisensis]